VAITTLPKARTALAYTAAAAVCIFLGATMPVRTINAEPVSTVRPPAVTVVADPTPAPAELDTAGVGTAACASIDPELYPCGADTINPATGERAMGVRW
jgi:hypothetical protein